MSREMKDSGIEWIGRIPHDWKMTKIKNVSIIGSGTTPKTGNDAYYDGNINWIQSGDLYERKEIIDTKKKITNLALQEVSSLKVYEAPFITVAMYGASIGNVSISKIDAAVNQSIGVIQPINILLDYLYYFLAISKPKLIQASVGGTQPNISQFIISNWPISFPDENVQQKIVDFLNKKTHEIDTLVEKTKQSIEEFKAYKQSLITETVTKGLNPDVPMKNSGMESIGSIPVNWQLIKLKYIYSLNKGLTITKANLQDKGIPVVSYGDIHSRYGFKFNPEINPVKSVAEHYLENNPLARLKRGDFVFADTSEDLEGSGNFTVFDSDVVALAGYHTIVLKSLLEINYKFIAYLFDAQTFRQQIQKMMQGVKVNSISQKILKNTTIWFPSNDEQNEIVEFLDERTQQIDNLITKKQQMLEELESYKQSLIYEYVTGKKEVK